MAATLTAKRTMAARRIYGNIIETGRLPNLQGSADPSEPFFVWLHDGPVTLGGLIGQLPKQQQRVANYVVEGLTKGEWVAKK